MCPSARCLRAVPYSWAGNPLARRNGSASARDFDRLFFNLCPVPSPEKGGRRLSSLIVRFSNKSGLRP